MILDVVFTSGGFAHRGSRRRRRGRVMTSIRQRQRDQSFALRTFIKAAHTWMAFPSRVPGNRRSALRRYVRSDPQFPMAWFGLAASS
jgi:hypothetical protein